MTEKRYTVGKQLKVIDDNILKGTFYVCTDRAEALKLADKLNEFHNENVRLNKENEQLKQQNETLSDLNNQELSEYEHKVFDIIDDKIAEVSDEKYKAINQQDVSAMLCFEAMIELLKELRNELKR